MSDKSKLADDAEMARLGAQFAQISAHLMTAQGGIDLPRLVFFAANVVPNAQACGVTLVVGRRRGETLARSHELVGRVDALQYRLREGPCLDASGWDHAALSRDLTTDSRWPTFGPQCAAVTGIRSMLATAVVLGGSDRSALNFYSAVPDAFGELDVRVAAILAPFAAIAVGEILRKRDSASFGTALDASRQIGTAVGILMTRESVTSTEAFAMLREASQHLNRRLRDLAAEVEWTGALPEPVPLVHSIPNEDPPAEKPR